MHFSRKIETQNAEVEAGASAGFYDSPSGHLGITDRELH